MATPATILFITLWRWRLVATVVGIMFSTTRPSQDLGFPMSSSGGSLRRHRHGPGGMFRGVKQGNAFCWHPTTKKLARRRDCKTHQNQGTTERRGGGNLQKLTYGSLGEPLRSWPQQKGAVAGIFKNLTMDPSESPCRLQIFVGNAFCTPRQHFRFVPEDKQSGLRKRSTT